jgi:hypothetical protein
MGLAHKTIANRVLVGVADTGTGVVLSLEEQAFHYASRVRFILR